MYALLPGFKWAVLESFADPVAKCHFEQGDILYNTPAAYGETWAESLPHIHYCIEVIGPKKVVSSAEASGDASVFRRNWESSVRVNFIDYKTSNKRLIRTTQGRLFTLLWKGDRSVLESEDKCHPPLLADNLLSGLKRLTVADFRQYLSKLAKPQCFLMPYDSVNPILRDKFSRLFEGLKRDFPPRRQLVDLDTLGLDAAQFMPTLKVALFAVDTAQREGFKDACSQGGSLPTQQEPKNKATAV